MAEIPENVTVSTIIEALLGAAGFLAAFIIQGLAKRVEENTDELNANGKTLAVHTEQLSTTEHRLNKLEDRHERK